MNSVFIRNFGDDCQFDDLQAPLFWRLPEIGGKH